MADEIEYTRQLLENVGTEILQSGNTDLIELFEPIKKLLETDLKLSCYD